MARRGIKYFNCQTHLPIYTLRLPWIRLYIINSTALIPIVQRQASTISFSPILIQVATNLMGCSKTALDIISKDSTGSEGFLMGVYHANHLALTPGSKLDALNERAVQTITTSFNSERYLKGPVTTTMNQWVYHHILEAVTEAVYGSNNPFRDPAIVDAWHQFRPGLVPLLVNIFPSLTARKYRDAREVLVRAFETYFSEAEPPHDASAFVKDRHGLFVKLGIPKIDMARIEAVTSLALLINTVPTATWLVYHVFSDPAILEDCRQELARAVRTDDAEYFKIDLHEIKHSCPVILSTFQEVLRVHATGVGTKQVLQDHLLDDKYMLKKGGIVMIPAAVQHGLKSVWGDDVVQFNYKRFLGKTGRTSRQSAVAFRAFGGGLGLCPGRHFAATDVLAFAAMVILRFDIRPSNGQWKMPTSAQSSQGFTINQPDHDLDIEIRPRSDRKWKVTLTGGSHKAMPISAEDLVGGDEEATAADS